MRPDRPSEFDISIIMWGYCAGRHFPRGDCLSLVASKLFISGTNSMSAVGYIDKQQMGDLYTTSARLEWHRMSMYHYFSLTAFQAYLSVSGAYRMLPPPTAMNELCGLNVTTSTRMQGVVFAAVIHSYGHSMPLALLTSNDCYFKKTMPWDCGK